MMRRFVLSLLLLLGNTELLFAQGQTGQVFGEVTDASGAVIPGAKVTLSGPAILQPQIATSSTTGSYQFPNIPIGIYSVEFQMAGYRSMVRSNIRIDIGFNAQVNAQLEVGAVEQSVVVNGEAPVVDTQSTAQSQELDQQALEGLPVARSFFNEVNLSPGVQNPAKDVGGAQNLNQPNFIALGAIPGQNRYFYDGADMGPAGGGNAMWVDYNTVQEMQVQSGGADATVQTSGMAINMVVKSGSDQFHGSFHDFEEGQKFEADNIGKGTPLRTALALNGASPGNALTHFRDIGADVGGPILKGKLWFWGNFGNNGIWVGADKVYNSNSDCAGVAANQTAYDYGTVRSCQFSFPTFIKAYAFKLGWVPFHNNTFTILNEYSVKQVLYNGLTTLVPLESTRPQNSACHGLFHWGGLADIADRPDTLGAKGNSPFWDCGWPVLWKFDDQQILSDRWLLDVSYMHYIKRNQFALQNDAEYNTAIQLENSSGAIRHSNTAVTTFQPMQNFKIASSYTLPGFLGGNHTFKFGYNWYRFENCCTDNAGAQAQEIFNSGTGAPFSVPLAVNFYRYGYEDQFLRENNVYVQDTYTHKNWTINAGVRWDNQHDYETGFTVPASPYEGMASRYDAIGHDCIVTPDCAGVPFTALPAATYAGAKDGVAWNTFAPRIGATYNLLGKGTTVFKGSFGTYYDQRTAGQLSDVYNTIGAGTTQQFVQYGWNGAMDTNGNPLMSGIDLRTLRTSGGNYNASNPTGTSANPNKVDPNIKDPRTIEFTAGVSQQLGQGFGITVTYTYRYFDHFIWNQLNGITSADFQPCTTTVGATITCIVPNSTTGATSRISVSENCPTTVAPMYPTQCIPVTYFTPTKQLPTAYTVTNQPDYHRTYQGVSVVVRKTLSRHWSLDGNATIQSNRQFWTDPDSYQDPTNIAQQNGAQYAPTASPGGGFPISVAVNARWNTKVGGTYRLPWWDIGLSAITDISQGYPYLSAINISSRGNGSGSVAVLVAHPGDQRLPTVQNTNFRVDKTFTFKDRIKAQGSLDWYNIFNSNTILGMQANQNNASANYIDYILSPSILRLGVKVSF
ncbi:MAG TPA: TonB-dependent receptor [Granulicella sp.]